MKALALLFTLGACFCWATGQILGKMALRKIKVMFFNTLRFSAATVVLVAGALLFGAVEGVEFGLPFLSAFMSGIFGWFVAATLFFYVLDRGAAYRIIPSGNAYPFWAILLSGLILHEEITFTIPISAVLVFSGIYLLARRKKDGENGWKYGVYIASIVAFIWGFNAVFNKFALNHGMGLSTLLLIRLFSATSMFWLASLTFWRDEFDFRPKKSIGLSFLSAIISFPIGSVLYVFALTMEKASVLAPVTGSTVMFGFVLSVIFLGEKPTKEAFIGVLLIFLGILFMV